MSSWRYTHAHFCVQSDNYTYIIWVKFITTKKNVVCVIAAGEAFCFPTVLFHWRWWSVRDSWSGHQPNCHPVTPQETICRSVISVLSFLCFVVLISILFFWFALFYSAMLYTTQPLYHSIFCWSRKVIFLCIICVGIHSVVFDEQCQHIVAMCSLEGEIVPLRNLIRISSLVEVKLLSRVVCECLSVLCWMNVWLENKLYNIINCIHLN